MNEDTRMQEWVPVWVQATNAINFLQVHKRQHILYFADHLFFNLTKASKCSLKATSHTRAMESFDFIISLVIGLNHLILL